MFGFSTIVSAGGRLITPIIAGVLFELHGILCIFIINSASFIFSAASEMFIDIPRNNKKPDKITIKAFRDDFIEGIRFIKNNKIILSITLLLVLFNFLTAPIISIGIPYILKTILKVTDTQFGLFQSAFVLPMFIAPVLCSLISKKFSLDKITIWNLLISSILFIHVAISISNIYLNLFDDNFIPFVTLFVLFFFISVMNLIANMAIYSIEQETIPLSIFGRVESVIYNTAFELVPLGQIIFGILLDKFEAWISISGIGIFTVVCTLLIKKFLWENKKSTFKVESTIQ